MLLRILSPRAFASGTSVRDSPAGEDEEKNGFQTFRSAKNDIHVYIIFYHYCYYYYRCYVYIHAESDPVKTSLRRKPRRR